MSVKDFNFFYKPYMRTVKISNLYRNQFKYNERWFNILYLSIYGLMICSFIFPFYQLNSVFICAFFFLSIILSVLDDQSLKNGIKKIKDNSEKLLLLPRIEQFKYCLWKRELSDYSSDSIAKAVSYLDVEIGKLAEGVKFSGFEKLIISNVILLSFWRFFDKLNLNQGVYLFSCLLIIYVAYKIIFLKLHVFKDRKRSLLDFKHNLLRLKAEGMA